MPQRRLEAIESLEELGAGFVLATHDLEIRGAGEFLGESQSGELTEVGLTMYLDMLESTVRSLKEGKDPPQARRWPRNAEVNLHLPALLPSGLRRRCADPPGTLQAHRGGARRARRCDDLQTEIGDRFGALPPAGHAAVPRRPADTALPRTGNPPPRRRRRSPATWCSRRRTASIPPR